jgi:hypothetical protein
VVECSLAFGSIRRSESPHLVHLRGSRSFIRCNAAYPPNRSVQPQLGHPQPTRQAISALRRHLCCPDFGGSLLGRIFHAGEMNARGLWIALQMPRRSGNLSASGLLTSASRNGVRYLIRHQNPEHSLAPNPEIAPAQPIWRSNGCYQPNQRQQEHDGPDNNPDRVMPWYAVDHIKQTYENVHAVDQKRPKGIERPLGLLTHFF